MYRSRPPHATTSDGALHPPDGDPAAIIRTVVTRSDDATEIPKKGDQLDLVATRRAVTNIVAIIPVIRIMSGRVPLEDTVDILIKHPLGVHTVAPVHVPRMRPGRAAPTGSELYSFLFRNKFTHDLLEPTLIADFSCHKMLICLPVIWKIYFNWNQQTIWRNTLKL